MNIYHRIMRNIFRYLDKVSSKFYSWCSKKYMYHDVMVVPTKKELEQRASWWKNFRKENGLGQYD